MSNPKHRLAFQQLDVFSAVPLEGNPLAVFADGRGLTGEQMQAVAREMNLSETTFILPRDAAIEREQGVQVRIFTVVEELPFAGHPTLGTAMVIHARTGAETVHLDLKGGRIPVRFSVKDGLPFGEMTQRDPEFGMIHTRDDVARAAGLAPGDIAEDVPIQTVSTGLAAAIVPLRSLAVLQKLAPNFPTMNAYFEKTGAKWIYFISRETVNPGAQLQARMIFSHGEDPATGSAAGPCAAWAAQYGVITPERQALIEQGVEMKRRSRIYITAGKHDGKVVNIRVAGHAVEVVQGEAFF
jgi:trans-2,3-dihydro-3-hydroxyanthranilate isomerase